MYIIFAIIVGILDCLLEYLLKITLGTSVTNMFIIGYLFLGAVIGCAIRLNLLKSGKRPNVVTVITSILVAIVTFVGIHYADYKTVYYKGESVVTYNVFKSNNGEHISKFGYFDGKEYKFFTFLNYEKYEMSNATLKIGLSVDILNRDEEPTPLSNYISEIFDFILMIAFALIMSSSNKGVNPAFKFTESREC